MLFESRENPKVIRQLLGHRDVTKQKKVTPEIIILLGITFPKSIAADAIRQPPLVFKTPLLGLIIKAHLM